MYELLLSIREILAEWGSIESLFVSGLGKDRSVTKGLNKLSRSLQKTSGKRKNSLLPVVSLLGVIIPALLSGAVIVEVVFALPGVGRAMVTAVFGRDYPILMAGASLAFFTVILFNLIADILNRILDPRIGNSSGGL